MNMKRLVSVLLVLCSVSAFAKARPAKAPDREVWITIGSDALEHVNAALKGAGHEAATLTAQKDEVTALRVRESQLNLVSRMMHEKMNRCGGFLYHDTEAAALAALDVSTTEKAVSATAVTYSIDNALTVNTLLAGLQKSHIRDTISHLSSYTTRYYTSTTGVAAANWLKAHWESLIPEGRTDVTVEHFIHPTWAQPSVIMTLTGASMPEEVVVLGGHLDSTSSGSTAPGADDDASGIATLTEVIRVAMLQGYRPARTVKFMAYAAEEVGLRGSSAIASKYRTDGVDVVGVLQLDMTNFKGSPLHDVAMVTDRTNAAQNTFITNLIDIYLDDVSWTTTSCGYGCSDHASWTTEGFAASMPFEAPLNMSNPYIHTVNDTLFNSGNDADHALKFAKVASTYMAELAKGFVNVDDETPPEVAITSPAEGSAVSGVTTVTASASDASGVSRVEFLVDGVVRATVNTPPYAFVWDTAAASNGSHTLSARAHDGVGLSATSIGVSVTVSNAASVAGFDPVLKAPRCFSHSHECDSGSLLNGRGGMGPEMNAPNTINSSCSDGLSGTYLRDESNEHIKVSTLDGTNLAVGKPVRIDATVWVYNVLNDKLDLFFAANANAPVWEYITTLSPTSKGSNTLSATYTLPEGATAQAVRAVFRLRGSPAACYESSYNDHDDLIFAVEP